MQGTIASVVVQVILEIDDGLDGLDGWGIVLALLHVRIVAVPRPGASPVAIVLGLHKTTPGVILDLGGADEVKAIDG